jgi:hypothetical protein
MNLLHRSLYRCLFLIVATIAALSSVTAVSGRHEMVAETPAGLMRVGDKVIKVNEAISMVAGFGNTFMVRTDEGNIIIDTSIAFHAPRHRQLLRAENSGPRLLRELRKVKGQCPVP